MTNPYTINVNNYFLFLYFEYCPMMNYTFIDVSPHILPQSCTVSFKITATHIHEPTLWYRLSITYGTHQLPYLPHVHIPRTLVGSSRTRKSYNHKKQYQVFLRQNYDYYIIIIDIFISSLKKWYIYELSALTFRKEIIEMRIKNLLYMSGTG